MSNFNFELNLNKHPKNCKPRSLVWAENVQVSDDGSCLQSEFDITNCAALSSFSGRKIIGQIACNNEVIFFVQNRNNSELCDIYRYSENADKGNDLKLIYGQLSYHGGEIIGTFTYNVRNHLIIAFSEFNCPNGVNVPLKTLDCGTFDNDYQHTDSCDLGLPDSAISLNPKIKIPSIEDFEYITGQSYKGYYHFFIRFKINDIDYTQWYPIGYPIFCDDIQEQTIFSYFLRHSYINKYSHKNGFTISDSFGTIDDVCNKQIKLHLGFDNSIKFTEYQMGFVVVSKEYQKAFRTTDIKTTNTEYTVDINNTYESSIVELTKLQYNYYDVKNMINDKNKLYIANYKEYSYKDYKDNIGSIKATILKSSLSLKRKTKGFPFPVRVVAVYQSPSVETKHLEHIVEINEDNYNEQKGIDTFIYNAKDPTTTDSDPIRLVVTVGGIDMLTLVAGFEKEKSYTLEYGDGQGHSITIEVSLNWFDTKDIHTSEIKLKVTPSWEVGTDEVEIFDERCVGDSFINRLKNTTLLPDSNYKFFVHFVNEFGEASDGYLLKKENYNIDTSIFDVDDDGVVSINDTEFNNTPHTVDLFNFSVQHTSALQNGCGYFISYEKFIKSVKLTGYLTKYDFIKNDLFKEKDNEEDELEFFPGNVDYNQIPLSKNIYKFYSSDIDLLDDIDLNVVSLSIIKAGNWIQAVNYLTQDTSKDIYSSNALAWMPGSEPTIKTINIKHIEVVHNHDFSKDNDYRTSYLKIETEEEIFDLIGTSDLNVSVNVKLNCEKPKYNGENKTLIKFTNVFYDTNSHLIDKGLNGKVTFNNVLIYNNNKFIVQDQHNIIVNNKYYNYISSIVFSRTEDEEEDDDTTRCDSGIYQTPVIYAVIPCYNDFFYESKSFNVKPEVIITRQERITDEKPRTIYDSNANYIVRPENSHNLFKLRFGSQDDGNPLTYLNENPNNVIEFNKRIQRSNQILDESFENNWRIFSPDDYKDITEPKGNITNLVSFGTTFLVHTEHSLFMFDTSTRLRTQDRDIQLATRDVFEIGYLEVLTSELGVCGLQDKKAFVSDVFGYIFYDNDAHRIYLFGQKELKRPDISIEQFLNKYKPYKVRFAHDKQSTRILVCLDYKDANGQNSKLTLSYNYKYNIFVSTHNYYFDEAFSTKTLLYMYYNNKKLAIINNLKRNIDRDYTARNLTYNHFVNTHDYSKNQLLVSAIVNDGYELIKTIEYLIYKLYKIKSADSAINASISSPVEEARHPFAGDYIRIYNDQIDTGKMDVSVTDPDSINGVMNYDKPHWELGNWNFNYFRNQIAKDANLIGDDMSRLYGNYFIIEFYCDITNVNERIEFETFDCQLTNNPTV